MYIPTAHRSIYIVRVHTTISTIKDDERGAKQKCECTSPITDSSALPRISGAQHARYHTPPAEINFRADSLQNKTCLNPL